MADQLGKMLKSVRELRAWSLARTAEEAGVSTAYLQKLERGEVASPSPHKLREIGRALEVPYADLMRLAGYAEEESEQESSAAPAAALAHALQAEDLSAEEIEELGEYLRFRRRQRQNS